MKKLLILTAFAASTSLILAQSNLKPDQFLKMVSDSSGDVANINYKASPTELENQLAALQNLLPQAPDQKGKDAANANICLILALIGKTDEAFQVVEQINDIPTREKRKLHVIKIAKGKEAAVQQLKTLLADPSVPPQDHIIYLEKLISTLKADEKLDNDLVNMATEILGKTKFGDQNARVGMLVIKFQQNAVKAKLGDNARMRQVLELIISNTTDTPKTNTLLEEAKKTLGTLPAQ